MVNKIKKRITDMGFVAKLRWTYVLVVLVPVLVLGGFAYYSSVSYVRDQKKANLESTILRSKEYVEAVIEQNEMCIKYLGYNNSLLSIFQETEDTQNENMSKMSSMQDIVLPLCYNVLLSNREISKLTIYSEQEFLVGKGIFKQLEEADRQEVWYQKAVPSTELIWEMGEDGYVLAKSLYDLRSKKQLGILKMDMEKSNFDFTAINVTGIPLQIQIGKDNQFVSYGSGENLTLHNSEQLSNGFTFETYVDESYLLQTNSELLKTIILVVACCFVLLTCVITVVSKSLVKRILVLTHTMQSVSEGEFDVVLPVESNDEIGVLYKGFNGLVNRVFHDIMREKELNIKILQAKINPHFLYNTLSTINWIAIRNDQQEIVSIITRLSTFYRNTLNHGEDIITIEEELKNIKSYIDLEIAIRGNVFTAIYKIDESLLRYKIPNFVLQPLVENAICHGICEDSGKNLGEGLIEICLQKRIKDGRKYIEIQVLDNGIGFQEDKQGDIPLKSHGYGLRNVDERLKLYCGSESGIEISKNERNMTAVIILLELNEN